MKICPGESPYPVDNLLTVTPTYKISTAGGLCLRWGALATHLMYKDTANRGFMNQKQQAQLDGFGE